MEKILVGLDVGTKNIKAVQLAREKEKTSLLAAGYIATPARPVDNAGDKYEQMLADSINRLVHEMKLSTTAVCASLPSSKVITRVIEVPILKEEELASAIAWEAESYIPLPLSKVKLDYCIVEKKKDAQKMKVLLVAAPIAIIEEYMRIITLAGLTPVALETEILAASRSISKSFPDLKNALVVSQGATATEIALLHDLLLIYTKCCPIGGNVITRALATELGFEEATAEEYKKTYGLEEDKLEGKIAKAISPFFTNIISEIEKTADYFKEQYPQEEINAIVLCGGGAKLPKAILALTKNLGLDTQISNPFVDLAVDPNVSSILLPDASLYTIAVGLALREV